MIDQIAEIRNALARPGIASSDFDLNPEVTLPEGRKLRAAGVLAPIVERNGRFELLLTKRSSALKHHPGQIAFPGGCLLYTSPSPRDQRGSRMPSSA